MIQNNNKSLKVIYLIFLGISIIISTLIIMSDLKNYSNYSFLAFLPLGFGIVICIFLDVYFKAFENLGIAILVGTYYLRMVIIPSIMRLGSYSSYSINEYVSNNINIGIILMIYEFFIVLMSLHFVIKFRNDKKIKVKNNERTLNNLDNIKIPRSLKVIIIIMIFALLACLILYPDLKYNFHAIIQKKYNKIQSVINYHRMLNSVPGIIYWPFMYIADIVRLVLPIILLISIKKYVEKGFFENLAILISLIIVMISGFIVTEEVAISIHICVALIIAITYIYPKSGKIIYRLGIIVGIPIIFLAIVLKVGGDISSVSDLMGELSKITQAYFSGPINVGASISMNKNNFFMYIPGDILKNIAFLGYFFQDMETTTRLFNTAYFGDIGRYDQIIPLIGQGYFYFGFIMGPLLSVVFSITAFKFANRIDLENNILKKYTYTIITILSATTPVLYNGTIFILFLFKIIIPLYLLTIIFKKNNNEIIHKDVYT